MRWRYVILAILLGASSATVAQLWPAIPIYSISGSHRRFMGEVGTADFAFLVHDFEGNEPPIVELRTAATGELISQSQLEWAQFAQYPVGTSRWQIANDRRTILWLRQPYREEDPQDYCLCGVFDTITGRLKGPVFRSCYQNTSVLSPDGRWVVVVQRGQHRRLGVIDVSTGCPFFEASSPTSDDDLYCCCYSPDSSHLLVQWPYSSDEPNTRVSLYEIESKTLKREFDLPPKRILEDWRENELWTGQQYEVYRHEFDGHEIGVGERDPFLDCFFDSAKLRDNNKDGTDEWAVEYDFSLPSSSWSSRLLREVQEWTGLRLGNLASEIDSRRYARLIDRKSGNVRFELKADYPYDCRFVKDAQLAVLHQREPNARVSIYTTNSWPRWMWSSFAGIVVVILVAIFARLRHRQIQRRLPNR